VVRAHCQRPGPAGSERARFDPAVAQEPQTEEVGLSFASETEILPQAKPLRLSN